MAGKVAAFILISVGGVALSACHSRVHQTGAGGHSPAIEDVVIYEFTSKEPDGATFEYDFPAPVKKVSIVYQRRAEREKRDLALAHVKIKVGSMKTIELPDSLIQCLPNPSIGTNHFAFTGYDPKEPKWANEWWKWELVVFFDYGFKGEELVDAKPRPIYQKRIFPYLEATIENLQLTSLTLHKGEGQKREIDLQSKACPRADIDWSLDSK